MVNKKKEKIIIDIHNFTEEEKKDALFALRPLQEITKGTIGFPDKSISIHIGYREITKELISNICCYLYNNKEYPEKAVANIIFGVYLGNTYIYTKQLFDDSAYKHYIVANNYDFPPTSSVRVNINYKQDTIIKTDKKTKRKTVGTLLGCLTPIISCVKNKKETYFYIDDVSEKGNEVFNKLVDKERILNCSYEEHLKEIKNGK